MSAISESDPAPIKAKSSSENIGEGGKEASGEDVRDDGKEVEAE
jgi:hypothetical protein